MTSPARKTIAVLLPDGFADWEVGMLAASARERFAAQIAYLTPTGAPVASIGGLRAAADGRFAEADGGAVDAVVVCGSDAWAGDDAGAGAIMAAALARGTPVGVICGATIAAARAGLLAGRVHTSNGRDWLAGMAPGYAGAELYRDGGGAVRDGTFVSAPGTAPATFAVEMLSLIFAGAPGLDETLAMLRAAR
ncbi:DJ-1/PfpI family protein [Salinarimonas rosea]|uniref:DJ-1/PfpI family protein n=1 Tax=Salinarimonas rosea TaxID=552063 RepID=UPI00048C12A6|nr:DJ-1/PfpI family protein [Salinarimonas rosea]